MSLYATLVERMARLTPAEFDQVLHPIFQEDELTLVIAGGVLGALSGALQWWFNVRAERRLQREKAAALDAAITAAAAATAERF